MQKWTYACGFTVQKMKVENSDPITSVLGLQWDRRGDHLLVSVKQLLIPGNLSKRKVLSLTQSVFDPLKFLTPALLPAKILL